MTTHAPESNEKGSDRDVGTERDKSEGAAMKHPHTGVLADGGHPASTHGREDGAGDAPVRRTGIRPPVMDASPDEGATLPAYRTEGAAALDLALDEDADVLPAATGVRLRDTGVHVAIPAGHVGLVIARSSLQLHGMALANGVGVIDPDYRGSIRLGLVSVDGAPHHVGKGTRVAQLLVMPAARVAVRQVDALDATKRGDNGFGSTGEGE